MRIHLIAIGGAIMHQLAIELKNLGHQVSGSDDVIKDPSYSNLKNASLLPDKEGFYSENITSDVDLVILGMHAKIDNVELLEAQKLEIDIKSFPDYIYEHSKNKKRVAICGSHGKTSVTSMIMHVLRRQNIDFDYLVGSSVKGFEKSVKLSDSTDVIIIEGDEYLSSALNKEPKFLSYKSHLAVLTGIEWDHINVFPTEEIYNQQFEKLIHSLEKGAKVFYYNDDKIKNIIVNKRDDIETISYEAISHTIDNGQYFVNGNRVQLFGKHNMENLNATYHICKELGVSDDDFIESIVDFEGAGRRLELIYQDDNNTIYRDFAHSPSKLRATVKAVKSSHSENIVAVYELHTFSTLNPNFLPQYAHTLEDIENPIIYLSKAVIEKKGKGLYAEQEIQGFFQNNAITLVYNHEELFDKIKAIKKDRNVFLMMSSGTFDSLDVNQVLHKGFKAFL